MKSRKNLVRFGFARALVAALISLTACTVCTRLPLQGQTLGPLVLGEPVVANGTGTTGQTASSSPVFLDVTKFLLGVLPADWCAKVNAAYLSVYPSTQGVVLDARGFPSGSTQLCNVQPFSVSGSSFTSYPPFWLLMGPYTVVTSVGWGLPVAGHIITGVGTNVAGSTENTIIQACGQNSTVWTGTNCGTGFPAFPGSGPTVTFAWPHGPGGVFPSPLGNKYGALLYDGANADLSGWISGAFGGQIRDLTLDCNGMAQFAYYSANEQENSGLFNVFGKACGAPIVSGGATYGAFAFWDKASSTDTKGGGAAHFTADQIWYVDGAGAGTGATYGLVYEGAQTSIAIGPTVGSGSCTDYPTAYPLIGASGTPGSGTITGAVLTYAGQGCTNTLTCTVNAPIGSGAMCSVTISGTTVGTLRITSAGSGYGPGGGMGGGPRHFSNWTIVGGADENEFMTGGVLIEGAINPVVTSGHCEYYNDDCVRTSGAGYNGSVTGGGTAQVIGGRISDIDAANISTQSGNSKTLVRLGNNGLSNFSTNTVNTLTTGVNDASLRLPSSTITTVQDDQHNVTLSGTNYPSISTYMPGSLWATDGLTVAPAMRNNSSNPTDLTGTIQLVAGHAAYNFSGTYTAAPACGCWDATHSATACSVAVTATGLTFTGSGGDFVSFICAGHN